ncbi:MAG: hypothetical protein ACXAEN_21085, partial [Candidatus Thorarchaeota archaeon]
MTDDIDPTIDSLEGPENIGTPPNDYIDYDSSNIVIVMAHEEYDAAGVSHGYINYTIDRWITWVIVEMGVVDSYHDGDNVYAVLMGRLPLIYGIYELNYTVIISDKAGNLKSADGEKSIGPIEDHTAPEFVYSRVVGAEPSLNGTLVLKMYEPMGASGIDMNGVQVSYWIGAGSKQTKNMTYNPETETWIYHLPALGDTTQIQYNFTVYDNAGNKYETANPITYIVQSFNASITDEDGPRLNYIQEHGRVGFYRTLFAVATDGVYGFVPLFTSAVANFTMWLDGQLIPNGAQILLSTNVHILTVRVESADENTLWGVKLVNMRSERFSDTGLLSFNVLAPAPDNENLRIQDTWATGIQTLKDHFTGYEFHDVAFIDGDFEDGVGMNPYWQGWEHYNAELVTPGYDSSSKAVSLYNATESDFGWISYDYPTGTYASGVSFYYLDSAAGNTNVTVAVQFNDKRWFNRTLFLDSDGSTWQRCVLTVPHDEIERVHIEHFETEAGEEGNLKIDDVALVRYVATISSWSVGLKSDISPHNVLGLKGGAVSVNYAVYSEFMSEEECAGEIYIEFGTDLQGVNVTVFSHSTELATVDTTSSIPIRIQKGLNSIALFVTTRDATNDTLNVYIKSSGSGIELTNMGYGTGLLSVTSNAVTVYDIMVDGEWNITTSTNADVTITSDPTSPILSLDITFEDDDAFIVITREDAEILPDISLAPVLSALFSTNVSMMISFTAEIRSANMSESVWVQTDWYNTSDYGIDVDLTHLASEIFGTASTEYYEMLNFEILLKDESDGLLQAGTEIDVMPTFKSRVGYIYEVSQYIPTMNTLYNDFEQDTGDFVFTIDSFRGYGAAVVGGAENLTIDISRFISTGMTLTYFAKGDLDTVLNIEIADTDNEIAVPSSDYVVQSLVGGWRRYELNIWIIADNLMSNMGIEGDATLTKIVLDALTGTELDSIDIVNIENVVVTLPYWNLDLIWNNRELGFVTSALPINVDNVNVPIYSIDYNGVTYATDDDSWYHITSITTDIGPDNTMVVKQNAFGVNVSISDVYTVSASGHISLERSVRRTDPSGTYANEIKLNFTFYVSEMLTDYFIEASTLSLLSVDGVTFASAPSYDSVLDTDDADQYHWYSGRTWSRDMSTVHDVEDTEHAVYNSDGDIMKFVPEPNSDQMWVELMHAGASLLPTYANYLIFEVADIWECDGYVNLSSSQGQELRYNFTTKGVHTVPLDISNNINSLKIGAVNVSPDAFIAIDWITIRDTPVVNLNNRQTDLVFEHHTPDFIESFLSLDEWTYSKSYTSDNDYIRTGINSGYLVMDGKRPADTGNIQHQVNVSTLIDVTKYPMLEFSYSIPYPGLDTNEDPYLTLTYVLADGTEDTVTYFLSHEYGSHTVTKNLTDTVSTARWITNVKVWIDLNGIFDYKFWMDYIYITDDVDDNDAIIVIRDTTTSESFLAVSDWISNSTYGDVATTVSPYDHGKFSVTDDYGVEFIRDVSLYVTEDSYLEFEKVNDVGVNDFSIALLLNNGSYYDVVSDIPTNGHHRYDLSEIKDFGVNEIVLRMHYATGA